MEAKSKGFIYWITATLLVILWISPILATVMTSLKTFDELNQGQFWTWPERLQWENYYEAFIVGGFSKYFVNSLLIAIPSVVGAVFLSCLNGYVLAKIPFKGSKWIGLVFLGGMLLPFQILLIPVFHLSNLLGTYDTIIGVVLFHVAFQIGFSSFFMRNFVSTIPTSILEAARMDGYGELRIFFTMVLPLMKPAMAALSTLLFTWIWNDYLWALILIQSDDIKPITVALQNLSGQWVASYHLQSAGAIIAAIPPVLIFILLQKHFIKGLTMGSVK